MSRGLGDVYKRQSHKTPFKKSARIVGDVLAVSYTHLTLPTTERV
ncbi:hypothetical protein JMUB7531_29210 [Staphylococcus aureus]